jgi:hypothetical protein
MLRLLFVTLLQLQAFLRALAKAVPAKPASLLNYRRMAAPVPPPERPLATADQQGDKALTTRALYAQVQVGTAEAMQYMLPRCLNKGASMKW